MSENIKSNSQLKQFAGVIGKAASMIELARTVRKVAPYKTTVLIVGESGTGKELLARSLHDNSPRKHKSFIAINCGAIPHHLIESELFGHKKGSFTDATRDKKGLFEEASGGTLFLDEIGELPLSLQAKLLRALQEGCIRPVGSEEDKEVDVRVIAATLRDLEQDSIDGRFRDDLYYRLNVLSIRVPPLRERIEDISDLVSFLLSKLCTRLGMSIPKVDSEAFEALKRHHWPGNIRELENYLERALILSESKILTINELPEKLRKPLPATVELFTNEETLSIKTHTRLLENHLISQALTQTKGNKTKAARLLEISHRTLLYKMKEYEIENFEG